MSWKNLFIKEDESKKEETPEAEGSVESNEEASQPEQAPEFNFSYKAATEGPVDQGVYVEEIASHLWSVLESTKKNMAFFDFLTAKKAMDSLPMDEAVKFQSTFVTLSTQGLTKEALLASINEHLSTLEEERGKFNGAVEQKREEQVGAREAKVAENEQTIADKTAQIQGLTEQIQNLQGENQVLAQEAQEENNSITSSVLNFETTSNAVEKELNDYKSQVDLYLSTDKKEELNEQ